MKHHPVLFFLLKFMLINLNEISAAWFSTFFILFSIFHVILLYGEGGRIIRIFFAKLDRLGVKGLVYAYSLN